MTLGSTDHNYPTRMHEVLGVEPGERFKIIGSQCIGDFCISDDGRLQHANTPELACCGYDLEYAINNGIIRKPRPGCWHCWNIEAHKIEYVTAVKDKDGRPMNTPVDIPYRYCPSCGRKLEVEE